MKSKTMIILTAISSLSLATTARASLFLPIDLSGIANTTYASLNINGGTYPTGSQTFDGKPFSINTTGNNIWHSFVASNYASGSVSVMIPVNTYGVDTVYTLISTYWGEREANTYASIEFWGSNNGYLKVDLDGDVQIRDYNYSANTTMLDPNWAKEVWSNGLDQHLDMQTFHLPDSFSDEMLQSIILTDDGGPSFQRSFIGGVTVSQSVPEPATILLFGTSLAGFLGARINRKRSAG